MKRTAAIVAAIAAALFLFGPMVIVAFTDRPLILDCGGMDPAVCDQTWRRAANLVGEGNGPVVSVRLHGVVGSCAQADVWRLFLFNPNPDRYQPLC